MDRTETEEARQLLLKLLDLAERMETRDARVIEALAQQSAALQATAQGVQAGGRRLAQDALELLRVHSRDAVQAGVGDAAAASREHLAQAATDAARASEALRMATDALLRQRRLWTWTAPLALLIGSLLAVGGAAYAVMHSRAQVERHRIEAALLRAYNEADVTLCGERLCANVDPRARGVGERGQYRPVKPRALREQ
ncbi:MAG: hypothetical protein ACOY37_05555 [Pseudomonadota bacterium]